VDIVESAPRSTAARALVESAVQAWRAKYLFARLMIVPRFASSLIQIQISSQMIPKASWYLRHLLTNLSIYLDEGNWNGS